MDLIENSRLETTQKSLWEIFLTIISDQQAGDILEVMKMDQKHIYFLTDNIEEKFWAMKSFNNKVLGDIIAKEKNYLLGV